MEKNGTALRNWLEKAELTEPLKTFRDNVHIVKNLFQDTSDSIDKKRNEYEDNTVQIEKWMKENEAFSLEVEENQKEALKTYEMAKTFHQYLKNGKQRKDDKELLKGAYNNVLRGKEAIQDSKRTSFRVKKIYRDLKSLHLRALLLVEQQQRQMDTLRPMVFIYLVTIWEAFILDTIKKILFVHPESISNSEINITISKAKLWDFNSQEHLRNYLIESEIDKISRDKEKLLSFLNGLGIDLKNSHTSLENIVEIQARRDIWVHNRGIVNQQYLVMVHNNYNFQIGDEADISHDYLVSTIIKLVKLARDIHAIADKKHYSKISSES